MNDADLLGYDQLFKGAHMADINPTNNNLVIGEGVTFKGSISAPGKAVINGNVTGELTADDLLIGTKGQVTGTVRAREIDVHGELNEDIVCKEHLLIHSTGKVSGTLEYHELEIQRGGKFKGNMNQK
jgi:cytoskeletal protein CcmA (bactofilin family)